MNPKMRKTAFAVLLLLVGALACSCAKKPSQEALYSKLLDAFAQGGYSCRLQELPPETPVGIYQASVWKKLTVGEETVLIYFDESNRADYLSTMIDEDQFGLVVCFGQRFILTYGGEDETLTAFLQTL